MENLLDLDMSATAEETVASPTTANHTTSNILDDLGSLSLSSTPAPPTQVSSPPRTGIMSPQPPANNIMSPASQVTSPPLSAQNTNMNDLLGLFGANNQGNGFGANVWNDSPQTDGPQTDNKPKSNEDILGLF